MIWRLFRPRPIVKVLLPGPITDEEHKMILKDLEEKMDNEYIVMLVTSPGSSEIKIELIK